MFDVGEHEWIWRDYLVNNSVSDDLGNILDKLVISGTKKRYKNAEDALLNLRYQSQPNYIQTPPPKVLNKYAKEIFSHQVATPKNIIVPKVVGTYVETIIKKSLFNKQEIELEMVILPAGNFMMGSDEDDSEKPKHQVILKQFAIAKYPVTQEQYQAIMGNNPSHFKNNPKNPVECVSWNDAQKFCQKLSQKTEKKYRLPSEAEWEYACRVGTETCYYFGDNEEQLGEYAWYNKNSDSETHPVKQKKPNNWGLYDMCGNVWEWCEDSWHENHENAPKDNNSWNENYSRSNDRVRRGGSWFNDSRFCRSTNRLRSDAGRRYYVIGFRVAVSLP